MSNETNKDLIHYQFYKQAVDEGNLHLIDELFSSDCAFYAAGSSTPVDRQVFKDYLGTFRKNLAFSHTIDDQIAEEDKVTTVWTVRGNHQGEFLGFPPTGKPITYSGVSIFYFSDGKIDKVWSAFDQLGMLKQLGLTGVPE